MQRFHFRYFHHNLRGKSVKTSRNKEFGRRLKPSCGGDIFSRLREAVPVFQILASVATILSLFR